MRLLILLVSMLLIAMSVPSFAQSITQAGTGSSQDSSATTTDTAGWRQDLNANGKQLNSMLASHAERARDLLGDEGRRLFSDLTASGGRIGQDLLAGARQVAIAGLGKIDELWNSMPGRMNNLVAQAGNTFNSLQQTAHEEVRQLKRQLAASRDQNGLPH